MNLFQKSLLMIEYIVLDHLYLLPVAHHHKLIFLQCQNVYLNQTEDKVLRIEFLRAF